MSIAIQSPLSAILHQTRERKWKAEIFGSNGRHRKRARAIRATTKSKSSTKDLEEDYYSVLGLNPDATPEEIKKAYYSCMKACHPDLSGNNAVTTNFCMFVNEVYEVLSDPEQRIVYDEINGYSFTSANPFVDKSCSKERVFVDEFSCIGCKNCANTAPCTFEIEEDYGRARVLSQNGNSTDVDLAIETCPVDCIHRVSSSQLTLLEDEMRRMERVNVGVMLSGMGAVSDVFNAASARWEKKQSQARDRARIRAMKEKVGDAKVPWWQVFWSSSIRTDMNSGEAKEKADRAAAAARRWREYSRKGVYRQPIDNLPEQATKDDR